MRYSTEAILIDYMYCKNAKMKETSSENPAILTKMQYLTKAIMNDRLHVLLKWFGYFRLD